MSSDFKERDAPSPHMWPIFQEMAHIIKEMWRTLIQTNSKQIPLISQNHSASTQVVVPPPPLLFGYLYRALLSHLAGSKDRRNAQVLYCNLKYSFGIIRKALEVSCGVWLKCVDEHCIIHEVICIIHFCCICVVCCGPKGRSNLGKVRNFLLNYFLPISCIKSPGRICYFCLNACFPGFFCN